MTTRGTVARSAPHIPSRRARELVLPALCVDSALAIGLGLLTIGLRYPWMMQLPWAWDSVLYLRAVFLFNATIHQPQPPGYLLYVSLARVIDLFVQDDHRALVWVSALAAGLATGTLYLVGRLLYDRLTGLAAAGLLASSVTFWFYSEVAYPYTTLAAGTTILALIALALRFGLLPSAGGAAAAGLAWALLGGFRQDLLLFMAPLFLAAMWGRPARDWLAGLGAGVAGVVAWLLPTAALSEGLEKYLLAVLRQGGLVGGASSVFALGLEALQVNAQTLGLFLFKGLGFALPGLLYCALRWAIRPGTRDPGRRWLALWAGPPLAIYLLAHIGDYGYTFSVLPALMVLAGRGLVLAGRDIARAGCSLASRLAVRSEYLIRAGQWALPCLLAGTLVLGNAYLFVRHHSQLSAAGIACFDQTMAARLRIVRERFRPDETLIFSSAYYQHVRYFLPRYRSWFWEPAQGPVSERRIEPGIRWLVVFDELAHPAAGQTGFERVNLPCNQVPFYYARVEAGDVVRFDSPSLTVTVQRG